MAWFVTEPVEFAIGDAVADTPPTLSARADAGVTKTPRARLKVIR